MDGHVRWGMQTGGTNKSGSEQTNSEGVNAHNWKEDSRTGHLEPDAPSRNWTGGSLPSMHSH
ncbi:GD10502 [Drosophila simulans]|uniref:GD10502 n=1 Tax=Drosophila simulans TaxID=7240 RepID=B4QEQ9_DROSI|nr:GD10502 [Drosophila simulans]